MTQSSDVRARSAWLVRHAIRFEIAVYVSIGRWILRRPSSPGESAQTHSYVGSVAFVTWVFIVLSAIEVPVAHLLIPWEGIRLAVLVLGIWGVTWALGYYAGMRMYPHVVHAAGLTLRTGPLVRLDLPASAISELRRWPRTYEQDRGRHVLPGQGGAAGADGSPVLALIMSNQTNIDIRLVEPRLLPGAWGRIVEVQEVRVWADDAPALVRADRELRGPGVTPR